MIIAGTGHRPQKLGGYTEKTTALLTDFARHNLRQRSPDRVICGMALGWDQALAQAALDIGIPMTAAVPFVGFDLRWPVAAQKRLEQLLAHADRVEIISPYPGTAALQLRNQWMVDRADAMLALWDGSFGGTFNCLRYAEKRGVPVENLWSEWEMLQL